MAARLIVNPVVVLGDTRMPLCATLEDPGRPSSDIDDDGNPVPSRLVHVSAISSGLPGERNGDCLSLCAGVDMTNLDAAAGVTNLFESGSDQPLADLRTWLTSTPTSLGWNAAKRNRVVARLTAVGADTAGLTASTPLWQIVNRLGQVWSPTWDVRVVRTMVPGG
jgi:hypothetical protein